MWQWVGGVVSVVVGGWGSRCGSGCGIGWGSGWVG